MKNQLKKAAAALTAAAILTAGTATGAVSVGATDGEKGSCGVMDVYTPSSGVVTQQVLFAMPGSWKNQLTEQCGNVAGAYWWQGADNVEDSGSYPGYKATQVVEDEIQNLFLTKIPAYGNGNQNASLMLWDNYLNPGNNTDPSENPYFTAAAQTNHISCDFVSRYDKEERFEKLFRYTYRKQAQFCELNGADALDINAETFWEDINHLAADALGNTWSSLSSKKKQYQIELYFDDRDGLLDFSEYGSFYAGNFFNEDLTDTIYPKESSDGMGISFTYNNMVYVIDLSVPVEQDLWGRDCVYSGDFYFYYGGGLYGTMPTRELNTALGCEEGSFLTEEYLASPKSGKTALNSVSLENDDNPMFLYDESDVNDTNALLSGTELRVTYAEPRTMDDLNYDGDLLSWDGEKYVSEIFAGESIAVTDVTVSLVGEDTVMSLTLDYGDCYACDVSTISVSVYIIESYKGRTASAVTLLQKPDTVFERRYTYGDETQCIPLHMEGAQVRVDYENGDSELRTFGADCEIVSREEGVTTRYRFDDSDLTAYVCFDSTMKDFDANIRIVSSEGYVYDSTAYVETGTIDFTARHIHKSGDIDGNGNVDISDVTTIQRYLAELTVFYDEQLAVADTNADGAIDISDATYLQMYFADYDVPLA